MHMSVQPVSIVMRAGELSQIQAYVGSKLHVLFTSVVLLDIQSN